MTLIEAADMILLASYSCSDHDSKTAARNSILAAVATVMDAARTEALEEAAKVADGWLEAEFDESANTMCQNICADIRNLAQPYKETSRNQTYRRNHD